VEKQKREKEKNTSFPEILKIALFFDKTSIPEFQQNKKKNNEGNCYGLDPG